MKITPRPEPTPDDARDIVGLFLAGRSLNRIVFLFDYKFSIHAISDVVRNTLAAGYKAYGETRLRARGEDGKFVKMAKSIPGVPVGTEIMAISRREDGTWHVKFRPTNVYRAYDLSTVWIPPGYERDGKSVEEWYRVPGEDELWLGVDGSVHGYGTDYQQCLQFEDARRIIVRKVVATTRVLIVEWENPSTQFEVVCRQWFGANVRVEERRGKKS